MAQSDAGSSGSIAIGTVQMTIGFAQEWLAWHDRQKAANEVAHHERQIVWTRWRRCLQRWPARVQPSVGRGRSYTSPKRKLLCFSSLSG
jgi:hypothetical protein